MWPKCFEQTGGIPGGFRFRNGPMSENSLIFPLGSSYCKQLYKIKSFMPSKAAEHSVTITLLKDGVWFVIDATCSYSKAHGIEHRATACNVITHRKQCKISCKIHFRMASTTRIQICAILEPQLELFCTNGYLSTWLILSLC